MSAADANRHWNTITSVATLGTSRANFSAESLWPDEGMAQNDTSRERSLLRLAAASYLWQVAGERATAVSTDAHTHSAGIIRQVSAEQASTTPLASKLHSADELASASTPHSADEPASASPPHSANEPASASPPYLTGKAPPLHQQPSIRQHASAHAHRPVSEASAWRLARMINGDYRELIAEWFGLAARAHAVIPPHWLPVVLDVLDVSERNAFGEVLGEHALWLADRNPAWSMRAVTADPSEERWTSGTIEERRIELTAMRARDPAQARRWLEATWPADPPDAREAFVRALLVGLAADDEPFLESALDNRRKNVRLAAAECLARLPDSAYARRSVARLEGLIALEPSRSGLLARLSKRRLTVELPASLDKSAIRDGIEVSPPASRKIGERTYWLAQMISLVRPAHWTARFACTAAVFLDAALATEHGADLLMALSTATVRYPDIEWIKALCERWIARHGKDETDDAARTMVALLSTAPAQERQALLQWLVHSVSSAPFGLVYTLLASVDTAWNAETTHLALQLIAKVSRGDTQQWSHTRTALAEWGRRADVITAAERLADILERCPPDSPWRNALEHLGAIVDFRLAMHKELLT